MLTPVFDITQDDHYLHIRIVAPNANIIDTEIEYEDNDFMFFSKPYFLRLTLPSKITENGSEIAKYDSDSGSFMVKVPKLNIGEHFEGLDMLTKLLAPNVKKRCILKPLIEVIDGKDNGNDDDIDEEYDWLLEQSIRDECDERSLTGEHYGFGNQYSGVIARLGQDCAQFVDITEPERKNLLQRRQERSECESNHFSDEHYLYDRYEQPEVISDIIDYTAVWNKKDIFNIFTDDDKFRMKNLPKKEYIFDKDVNKALLLGAIDILYAFVYDIRVNEGEHTVESAWNISKLSATLSWFDSFCSLKEVMISSIRRSLCYPLYRNWDLALKVVNDVILITRLGRSYVLKCFLDMHKIFNETGDNYYILNDLYITDYCVWLQHVKPSVFQSLSEAIEKISITRDLVALDIDIIEQAGNMAIEEDKLNRDTMDKSATLEQLNETLDKDLHLVLDDDNKDGDNNEEIDETSSESDFQSSTSSSASHYSSVSDDDISEEEKCPSIEESKSDSEEYPPIDENSESDNNDSNNDLSSSSSSNSEDDISGNVTEVSEINKQKSLAEDNSNDDNNDTHFIISNNGILHV